MVYEEINSNESSRLLAAIPPQQYASTSQNVTKYLNNLITFN